MKLGRINKNTHFIALETDSDAGIPINLVNNSFGYSWKHFQNRSACETEQMKWKTHPQY